ncbi:UDP-N-acetylhexosamine pyrophosphorylase [Fopius arisanus]|uniref:UDP-N-acetylglucosamine diphosphorylase n=1 Tax=Fopius arisanus TaxID=64838 RepID=A0A9R1TB53_9HYME|nr:PREDICTED: UDP-N-acetylhexosamine pyrophosphorylase [Fopius arisanus]
MNIEPIRAQLKKYNQDHLLAFWEELTPVEQKDLTEDIFNVDLVETNSYFSRANDSSKNNNKILDDEIKPIDSERCGVLDTCSEKQLMAYEERGLREIADGKAAVVLMAGGQGTRLGVTYPKGMYDVGLPSRKTLFQLQAERIRRLETLAEEKCGRKGSIPWYILTSEATDRTTNEFLKRHDYFGLKEENVKTFKQCMIPCYDFNGKILLDDKHKISRAPDGNGGLYRALQQSGILNDMRNRGIRSVHAHSVDNILIKVADPYFIGYCLENEADCGVLVVEKTEPTEAIGVVCQVDGHYRVVEYSEISKETSELRRPDGRLLFSAGNVCNHYFTVEFLTDVSENHERDLELHLAKKKIPFVDKKGERQVPTSPNGIKVEKFVFDVFKYSRNFAAWVVPRDSHFSPLKNSDSAGQDCPITAKRDVLALHKNWLLKAGVKSVVGEVEVSPLRSYMGENLDNVNDVIQGPIILE